MIHEEPHPYDRQWLMLLAFAISFQIVSLFDLEIVVRAIVIQDIFTAFKYFLTVFIKL
ncbi:MAG: hypothetical protein BWY61_02167 [Firmicutes bacterium ADurb.Bin354]|nr:MAG: hypothetical protein BWY61_02167 [Firmicutes bacterium ADurb.Bin354]